MKETSSDFNPSEKDGFNYYQKVKKDYEKRILDSQ